jgi:hypothetical protein
MTCLEKLKKDHPDWDEFDIMDVYSEKCPSNFGYLPDPSNCFEDIVCKECWKREIPEEPVTPTEEKSVNEQRAEQGLKPIVEESYVETHILDSGDRTEFETGAVRDMREGKGRCDLVPLEVMAELLADLSGNDVVIDDIGYFMKTLKDGDHEAAAGFLYAAIHNFVDQEYGGCMYTALLEVAKHYEEGAKKYGPDNWQKGIPVWCYIDSAIRHYLKHRRGDKDEPHDRAFVWNLMCCIWEVDYHEKDDKDKEQTNA